MAQNRLEISLKGKDLKHTQTHTKKYQKLHASHMHTCWMETHTHRHTSPFSVNLVDFQVLMPTY